MGTRRVIGRREFLRLSAVATGATLLAACGPTSSSPSAQPTATAPAAPAAAVSAGTTSSEPALGAHLIGTLEGPEVVLEAASFPTEYNEAPELAEMVAAGQLPPVAERIGEDPLVIEPLHEIGTYGGTLRRAFTGPSDQWSGARAAGHDTVLFRDYSATTIVPNIAASWEFSDDARTLTLHLRRGMKWSDGHPFTADDFMFWYEDMYLNKELVPGTLPEMTINGKPVTMEKVDDYTVRYNFPDPYPFFAEILTMRNPGAGQAQYGRDAMGGYAPAHYLKQFHPSYVSQEELDAIVAAEGFDNWVRLFKFKNDWALNTELPVVTAWKTTSPANTPTWTKERNPYSIWVDTAGNQLPYIDRVVTSLAENLEVLNLRAIAGEYDYQERHIDLGKLPVLLENQEKGNYTVHLDPGDFGSDMYLKVNLSYEADPEIARWLTNVDFRRALSLGIDRDQLNETFWLGLGTPGSPIPSPNNPYYPGDEYRTLWHTYDPQRANEMLDALGLTEKDAEGYRLRTDGQGRLRIEVTTVGGNWLPFTQISEMIRTQWQEIGIEMDIQEQERGLATTRARNNELQLFAWSNDTSENLFTTNHHVVPNENAGFTANPLHAQWYMSNGAEGKEPPPGLREALELFRRAASVSESERIEMGKRIWALSVDEVWHIGIVGLSPANMGVRVVNNNLGNTPQRQYNSNVVRAPGGSRPEQFYWKS